MDEVFELCRRVLGASALAERAAAQASAEHHRARVPKLAAAVAACRGLAEQAPAQPRELEDPARAEAAELTSAVARELAQATARLPERQREVLALRELLGLSYREIARAMHTPQSTVPLLLAQARLQLQAERRGTDPDAACADRDRALRLLACRQDSEPAADADQEWLFEHVTQCAVCGTAHAAMLEASVCYRAWKPAHTAEPAVDEALAEPEPAVDDVPAEPEPGS